MEIVRYADRSDRAVRVGVRRAGRVSPLAGVGSVSELLRLPLAELRGLLEGAGAGAVGSDGSVGTDGRSGSDGLDESQVLLLPPVDGLTEVWASGVTYERSMAARVEESSQKDAYQKVYEAERPELFFKAPAWRVVTDGEPVAIRTDSGLDVPEPELGVVANAYGEIVGYVACNDMSSRAIEGENPLYLPQAKVYAGSCAISTGIRPAWEISDATSLDISLAVVRDGQTAWKGETSTARMHRDLPTLVDYLFRGDAHPAGAFLATGTGIIPEMSFTLAAGDRVEIEVAEVGVLSNPVVVGKEPLAWLVDALSDPFAREVAR